MYPLPDRQRPPNGAIGGEPENRVADPRTRVDRAVPAHRERKHPVLVRGSRDLPLEGGSRAARARRCAERRTGGDDERQRRKSRSPTCADHPPARMSARKGSFKPVARARPPLRLGPADTGPAQRIGCIRCRASRVRTAWKDARLPRPLSPGTSSARCSPAWWRPWTSCATSCVASRCASRSRHCPNRRRHRTRMNRDRDACRGLPRRRPGPADSLSAGRRKTLVPHRFLATACSPLAHRCPVATWDDSPKHGPRRFPMPTQWGEAERDQERNGMTAPLGSSRRPPAMFLPAIPTGVHSR
jgi:hypothetical protein